MEKFSGLDTYNDLRRFWETHHLTIQGDTVWFYPNRETGTLYINVRTWQQLKRNPVLGTELLTLLEKDERWKWNPNDTFKYDGAEYKWFVMYNRLFKWLMNDGLVIWSSQRGSQITGYVWPRKTNRVEVSVRRVSRERRSISGFLETPQFLTLPETYTEKFFSRWKQDVYWQNWLFLVHQNEFELGNWVETCTEPSIIISPSLNRSEWMTKLGAWVEPSLRGNTMYKHSFDTCLKRVYEDFWSEGSDLERFRWSLPTVRPDPTTGSWIKTEVEVGLKEVETDWLWRLMYHKLEQMCDNRTVIQYPLYSSVSNLRTVDEVYGAWLQLEEKTTSTREMPYALFKDFVGNFLVMEESEPRSTTKPILISKLLARFRREVPGFKLPFDRSGGGGAEMASQMFHLLVV